MTRCVVAALLLVASYGMQEGARAAGALAIGVTDNPRDGIAYGWAIDFDTVAKARSNALEKCHDYKEARKAARFCKLIGAAKGVCVSIAFDPKDDSTGMGWAVAGNATEAEKQALDNCQAAAPRSRREFCKVDLTKCDTKK